MHCPGYNVEAKEFMVKRIQYHRYGGPEELRLEEVELPRLTGGQVLVRVRASSVNPMDWGIRNGRLKMLTGSKFPRGLGHDFAGIVEAVGPKVRRLKVGDEVVGGTGLKEAGAHAEAVIADEANTFTKPKALSFEIASTLPIVCATASTALFDKAKLRVGQSLFVTGCLGSVGRATVQLALMQGAIVDGSCSASDRAEAFALGVREVFDYRALDVGPLRGRYDVVIDAGNGLSLAQCDVMLKRRGVAVHCVGTRAKMLRALFSASHETVFAKSTPECMASMINAAVDGRISPKIGQTVPLSEAIAAISELEKNRSIKGKLVIVANK